MVDVLHRVNDHSHRSLLGLSIYLSYQIVTRFLILLLRFIWALVGVFLHRSNIVGRIDDTISASLFLREYCALHLRVSLTIVKSLGRAVALLLLKGLLFVIIPILKGLLLVILIVVGLRPALRPLQLRSQHQTVPWMAFA
ncbi:hypothetical protein FZEAL_10429 [Fusarium zealandicum]|uniref:Uncharacterized protein n=1 Tax=Fusarium zealandicum TaxID=1053134 RepID=A0A8H4U1Q7_9HYPO|nr:hypothetical protein FZEAL_10429 [Fusarium zealandicum]